MSALVTLLTDFGDADGFVGALRGVLLSRAPNARLVDLAHHVPRGDVDKAARVLARSAPWFPAGAVHLVVVDPGVGSARRPIAVRAGGHLFVAPDNGVLGETLARLGGPSAAHVIQAPAALNPDARGTTFHGRDVFAPAAGALAAGLPLEAVGPPAGALVHRPRPGPRREGRRWRGAVVEVDVFGNLVTDLPALAGPVAIEIGDARLEGPHAAYADVAPGALVLVVGSEGTYEVSVRDGSAARRLDLGVGAPVACERVDA